MDDVASPMMKHQLLTLNLMAAVPTCRTVKKSLHLMKVQMEKTIKDLLVGFSLTQDHWTSATNKTYTALILHTIHDFLLKQMVLTCVKHDHGSAAAETDERLVSDLAAWELQPSCFVALVTDTASNMTCLGRL